MALSDPCDRPGEWDLSGETRFVLLDPGELGAQDIERWDRLGEASGSANVFAAPWFMRASLRHCPGNGAALLATVTGPDGEWLGMLPVARAQSYGRVPFPHWAAWRHANMFEGTPLVRTGHAMRFWRALFAGLSLQSPGRSTLRLFDLPSLGPATAALLAVCEEDGLAVKTDRRFARASLSSGARPELAAEPRRRIEALWRKLARELGEARIVIHRDPATIVGAGDSFLQLERAGWKGRAGSALASADDTRGFFAEICREGTARGNFEMAVLELDGRPLAAITALLHRGWGYGFKMAYDEAFAAYAPGVLLLDRLTDRYAAMPLAGFDSCCAPGQQPVERLWTERREFIDCGVAMGGIVGQFGVRLLDLLDTVRRAKHA